MVTLAIRLVTGTLRFLAVDGFGGIAGVAVEAAKRVFFVALILLAISVVVDLVRGRAV